MVFYEEERCNNIIISYCHRNTYAYFKNYPPGSKCEALRLGVHLILLYFIRILVVGTEIIFLFCWCWGGCWWRTFFVFKSLNNKMVYTSVIDVYVCKRNRCTTKVLWVLKFWEVGGQEFFFSKSPQVGRFLTFHAKLQFLCWFLLFWSKKKPQRASKHIESMRGNPF